MGGCGRACGDNGYGHVGVGIKVAPPLLLCASDDEMDDRRNVLLGTLILLPFNAGRWREDGDGDGDNDS